jgi:hypothetical protein
LTSEVGPDASGSKPGKDRRAHMPEKSVSNAAPCAPASSGPAAGPAVCPQDGIAASSSVAVTRADRVFMMVHPLFVKKTSGEMHVRRSPVQIAPQKQISCAAIRPPWASDTAGN